MRGHFDVRVSGARFPPFIDIDYLADITTHKPGAEPPCISRFR